MAKPRRGTLADARERMEQARAATESPLPQEAPATVEPAIAPERSEAKKAKLSIYLDADMIAEARGAVAWAQMRGQEPDSISGLVSQSVRRELDRLIEALEPDGGEFPRLSRARKGRPPNT